MRKILCFLFFFPIFCYSQNINILNKVSKINEKESVLLLKEILNSGVEKGIDELSLEDGFFLNNEVKIPFPPISKKSKKRLKKIGLKNQIDLIVLNMNRVAERSMTSIKPIFLNAIINMNINNAISIIKGEETSGTSYLRNNTQDQLFELIYPTILLSLEETKTIKYWKDLTVIYNKIPFVEKMNFDLSYYVTSKTIEGVFIMIEKEEINIRNKITGNERSN